MRYANEVPDAVTPLTDRSDTLSVVPTAAQCRPASLAAELRVAVMFTARRMRYERSTDDVTPGQYSVLAALDRHAPMTPRELATHEKVQPPSMTRTLGLLEDLGLVRREEHPSDRRQALLYVTPEGAQVVHETRRQRDRWLAKRLAELDVEERQVLARAGEILNRISSS
jgi:DNA-binding MarR family transcriptional regulator